MQDKGQQEPNWGSIRRQLESIQEDFARHFAALIEKKRHKDYQRKNDGSLVTSADIEAGKHLESLLLSILSVPVKSEENPSSFSLLSDTYWLIDPVDGTQSLVEDKHDQHCSLVALISNGRPVVSAILAPLQGKLWSSSLGGGCHLNSISFQRFISRSKNFSAVTSSSEPSKLTEHLRANGFGVTKLSSGLKFAFVAEGKFDLYVRSIGSCGWDLAAGELLVKESGCDFWAWSPKNRSIRKTEPYGPTDHLEQLPIVCGHPTALAVFKKTFG